MTRAWVIAIAAGAVGLASIAGVAHASPIDAPAFSAPPADLLAAAQAAPPGDTALVLRERDVTLDPGQRTERKHFLMLVRAVPADALVNDETYTPPDAPPAIRARVIAPDGHATDLDASGVSDAVDPDDPSGRRHRVAVHLPQLRAGSVIEVEVVRTYATVWQSGDAARIYFDGRSPTATSRVTISAPAGWRVRFAEHGLPRGTAARHTVEARREVWRYELPARPAMILEPADHGEGVGATVELSTVPSWNALARELRRSIDARIAAGAPAWPAGIAKAPTLDTVRAIVAWVRAHAPVAAGRADVSRRAFPPATPADVIAGAGGDGLSVAVLTAALLRQASLRADVALTLSDSLAERDPLPGALEADAAIVRVKVGGANVWIDPASRYVPVGQLAANHLRSDALILAGDAAALVTTPRAPETAAREVRTYQLAETGPAHVTLVYRETGEFAAIDRDDNAGEGSDAMKRRLTDYAQSMFGGQLASLTTSPLDELEHPYEHAFAIEKAQRASGNGAGISIALPQRHLLDEVPLELRSGSPRTHPLYLLFTYTHEIENRVVVPDGFELPTLEPDRTRELGALRLTEHQALDGRILVITARLELASTTLTAAEVEATRTAIKAFEQTPEPVLEVRSTIRALQSRHEDTAAVAEAERLIQLHPREALHHDQLAELAINLGDGALARREATIATQLEPDRAHAWMVMGWVMEYDSLGRSNRFDADRTAALAGLQKAHAMAPDDPEIASELATALEYDAHGAHTSDPAELRDAIRIRRALIDVSYDALQPIDLGRDLLWSGDRAGAEAVLRTAKPSSNRDSALVAAMALGTPGVDAALREADALASGTARATMLAGAAWLALQQRAYHLARRLVAPVKDTDEAKVITAFAEHATRFDTPFAAGSDIVSIAVEAGLEELEPDRPRKAFWDDDTAQEVVRDTVWAHDLRVAPLIPAQREDLVRGMVVGVVGTAPLWRVEIDVGEAHSLLYFGADRGVPKLVGSTAATAAAGRHVLRLLDRGDDAQAMQLLDWLAADKPIPSRARVWGAGAPRDHAQMLLAGAAYARWTDPVRALTIATDCATTAKLAQAECDSIVIDVLEHGRRWSELLDRMTALEARSPDSDRPFAPHIEALRHLGRLDEAEAFARAARAKLGDDKAFAHAHVMLEVQRGDLAAARASIDGVLQATRSPDALNNFSWLGLFAHADPNALDAPARRAVVVDSNSGPALNTLAAIEAEEGMLRSSFADGLRAMELTHHEEPGPQDWYVFGRYYEQLGLRDDAIAAYKRAVSSPLAWPGGTGGDELAAKRLAALGVK